MKFKIEKTKIQEILDNIIKAAASKAQNPALEGVKLRLTGNELELTCYDLELGITTQLEVDGQEDGESVFNAKLFLDIIRKMPDGEVNVSCGADFNAVIENGSVKFRIKATDAEDYPKIPEISSQNTITISQDILKSMIAQTIHAIAASDEKPILTGELFDIFDGQFNLVALDKVRLAIRTERVQDTETYKFVVPGKALQEISRILKSDGEKTCGITTDNRQAVFKVNEYTVFSRLLEGEFNNYKLISGGEDGVEVIINTLEFIRTLDRCSLLINDKMRSYVKCEFTDGVAKIECKSQLGNVNEEISADVSGGEMTIGFNHKFMLDALKASECDKVLIKFNGANRPFTVNPLQGDSFKFLIMPVNLR